MLSYRQVRLLGHNLDSVFSSAAMASTLAPVDGRVPPNGKIWSTFCPERGIEHHLVYGAFSHCPNCGCINPDQPTSLTLTRPSTYAASIAARQERVTPSSSSYTSSSEFTGNRFHTRPSTATSYDNSDSDNGLVASAHNSFASITSRVGNNERRTGFKTMQPPATHAGSVALGHRQSIQPRQLKNPRPKEPKEKPPVTYSISVEFWQFKRTRTGGDTAFFTNWNDLITESDWTENSLCFEFPSWLCRRSYCDAVRGIESDGEPGFQGLYVCSSLETTDDGEVQHNRISPAAFQNRGLSTIMQAFPCKRKDGQVTYTVSVVAEYEKSAKRARLAGQSRQTVPRRVLSSTSSNGTRRVPSASSGTGTVDGDNGTPRPIKSEKPEWETQVRQTRYMTVN